MNQAKNDQKQQHKKNKRYILQKVLPNNIDPFKRAKVLCLFDCQLQVEQVDHSGHHFVRI